MKVRLLTAVFALVLVPAAFAEEKKETENPYKKLKVGEFAKYTFKMKIAGMDVEGSATQTVAEKTDKEATLKVVSSFAGMDQPEQSHKIDLTKPYDPFKSTLPADAELKVEVVKEGKEKIKAGGKEFECTWKQVKMKLKMNGMDIEAEGKTWESKDMPFGLVKTEMSMDFGGQKAEMTMELAETGKKKAD